MVWTSRPNPNTNPNPNRNPSPNPNLTLTLALALALTLTLTLTINDMRHALFSRVQRYVAHLQRREGRRHRLRHVRVRHA